MSGKDPEECDEIFYSALLHDVGRIGVPGDIPNLGGKKIYATLTGDQVALTNIRIN